MSGKQKVATPWLRALRAILVLTVALAPAAATAEVTVEVYTRPGCTHCLEASRFLEQLSAERSDLLVVEHAITRDRETLDRLRQLTTRAGITTPGVPTFVIGANVLVGFDPDTTPVRIRALLDGTGSSAREPPATGTFSDAVELPVFGIVDPRRLGLPLFTIVVGLIDGFNPCAMWVLLFLLAMLVNLRDRSRIALIAGTFVVVSGVSYFAFMAAWLTFFMVIGVSGAVRVVLAVVALGIGVVHVKDFLAMGYGPSLSIPQSAKPGLYRRIGAILRAEDLPGALAGIVVLAVLVNLVELLCTAGLPALYTAILTSSGLPSWKYYAYLSLYVSAYMLDDAVLVTIAVVTLRKRKLQEHGGRWLKLLSGAITLTLGAMLLLRPEWMGF